MRESWKTQAMQRLLSRTYRDEVIVPRTTSTPAEPVPKLIRAMRSLVKTSADYWQSRSELFVKQARLMASYEDDYVYRGVVNQYYPTYESLSDAELRGYFTWRTQVRHGHIEKRGMTYASLYVYELLHLIGCVDAQEGYERLHAFGMRYAALDPQFAPYLMRWEMSFVVYYDLDAALLARGAEDDATQRREQAIAVMLRRTEHTAEEIMAALCALSSYRLERSKLYRAHAEDVHAIVLRVLADVDIYYEKHRQKSFFADYIAVPSALPIQIFPGAVFHPPQEERDRCYVLPPLRRYECSGGRWVLHAYERPRKAPQRLGALLRGVDAEMRMQYGISPLQLPKLTKWQWTIIRNAIDTFMQARREMEAQRVMLDFSKLAQIRSDAAHTQERLIVEEDEIALFQPADRMDKIVSTPIVEASAVLPVEETSEETLNAAELHLLRALLTNGDLTWVRAEGHILAALIDEVNEKLYDDFADTVIEGEPPAIVSDYQRELRERYLHGIE